MGIRKSKSAKHPSPTPPAQPQLARRRANRQSTIRSGRTIGVAREKLQTASQRQAAHDKAKRKKRTRIIFVSLVFIVAAGGLLAFYFLFVEHHEDLPIVAAPTTPTFEPSIEIVDADGSSSAITSRMRSYIGQAEADFRDLGYRPTKAVIPSGAVREVDFYLDGYTGFIKMLIDRDTAPSVEDADRLIRYLKGQGITDFKYLDVRLPYKAYWQ